MSFIDEIRDSHDQLLTVFGKLREVVLPTQVDVQKLIPELFASVGVKLIDIPFSLERARSSFLKTIHKVQPSHNSQQFKDGVLWALEADGLYTPENNSFSEVGMLEVSFRFLGPTGTQEERKGVYLRTDGIVIGHRTASSKIRHKL